MLVIGAITALFMGFLGIIQNDIKRVVAYSTLSQLGYMTVALGASAYSVARVPPDDARLLQGAAVPRRRLGDHRHAPRPGHPQHGRPAQVHADHLDHVAARLAGADRHAVLRRLLLEGQRSSRRCTRATCRAPGFAYFAVLAGVFVTAFYSFRMYFLVFHGEERFDKPQHARTAHDRHDDARRATTTHQPRPRRTATQPHESPWVVTLPLVLLAIPSVVIGFLTIGPMLFGDFFKDVDRRRPSSHPAMEELARGVPRRRSRWRCTASRRCRSGWRWPAWSSAWYCYMVNPALPAAIQRTLRAALHAARQQVLHGLVQRERPRRAARARSARGLWKGGDVGADRRRLRQRLGARWSALVAGVVRRVQTGYIYHYAFVMILGVFVLMTWQLWPFLPADRSLTASERTTTMAPC